MTDSQPTLKIRTATVPRRTYMHFDHAYQGVNPIWKGYVVTSDNIMEQAYVKKVNNINELYKEVVCSLLGRAIGINTPEPLIVYVDKEHPQINSNPNELFFGTIDCESNSFARYIEDNEFHEDEILTYQDLHKIISFDELVANADRHSKNILFNGTTYFFIDHGETFIPALDYNQPLIQHKWGRNILAENFKTKFGNDLTKTKQFLRKVESFISSFVDEDKILNIDNLSDINQKDLNNHHKNIKNFLIQRLPLLIKHVKCCVSSPLQSEQLTFDLD